MKLDSFIKPISLEEYHKQNAKLREKNETEQKNIPTTACYDRYGAMFVPYGCFWKKSSDTELILYKRSNQRKKKIRNRRNDQWDTELTLVLDRKIDYDYDDWIYGYADKIRFLDDENKIPVRTDKDDYYISKKIWKSNPLVTITHSGLNSKKRSIIERSIKKINIKTIPVYQCFNEYSFTQVIPPPKRKKNRPPPFATLLNSPSNLKINGVRFNFKKQLEILIIREFRANFKYAPLSLSKYESKVDQTDDSFTSTFDSVYEYRREDRIVFLYSSVPVIEVVRAVCSIFAINFSTPEDRFNFASLIKNILFNSSFFTITQYSFVLGYADIFFANCFIPTLKYFPFYRQIMCEFSPKPSNSALSVPDYDIEMNDYWYDYWSSNKFDYGSTSFVESEIIGMESFHKLNIPLIHLKTRSEKDDQEEKKESDPIIKSNSDTEFNSKSILDPNSIIKSKSNIVFNSRSNIDPNSMTPLDPNTISVKHVTNPTTSNTNRYINTNANVFHLQAHYV